MRLPRGYTRRSDGRLEYRFTLSGTRYSVYGRTVKECIEKADERRKKLSQGLKIDAGKITFTEYAKEWLGLRSHAISEATVMNYEYSINKVSPVIGSIKLVDLDRRDILKLQATLRKTYSSTVTNSAVNVVSFVCRAAVMDRVIPYNPCEGIKPLRRVEPKMTKTVHRALTKEEQTEFFRLAREKKSFYYELFVFLIQTGVRIGEAVALTWSDIDYANNVIHINKTLTKVHGGHMIGSIPKTEAGSRDIPMTRDIKLNLSAWRDKTIKVHGLKYVNKSNRVFLQKSNPDRLLLTSSVDTALKHLLNESSIKHFSAHAFRDTFATRAAEQGMQPNTLKEILGHSTITITMDIYAQVQKETKQSGMDSLVISV